MTVKKNIREIGGELHAELAEQLEGRGIDWNTNIKIVDIVMAVLAQYHGFELENDSGMPIVPLGGSKG